MRLTFGDRGMRAVKLSVFVLLTVAGVAACKGGPKVSDKNLRELDYRQLQEALAAEGENVVLVDARPASQFDAGHLPRAMNLFLPDVKAGDGRLKQADRIIVYAGGWQDPLGPATAKRLMSLKYHDVYLFRGGMEVWERQQGGQGPQPATAPAAPNP
jgi:rhodanese-related sulfurtransferase